ncbi:ABC transporter [Mycena alexandri]|uniref:ABC transporter n=1 Tax=Mycena alexandri TaxID=1745969 RepID=A0AAD6SFX1_9AGAR|nr:ABC transporter [Mycena alexandri]
MSKSSQVDAPSPRHSSSEHTLGADAQSIRSAQNEKAPPPPAPEPSTILTGSKLAIVFVCMLLSVFLVALDQTILATALPRIASDFNAFSLQGWVSSSFVLAQSVFLLFYGQVLRIFPAKWVLISAIAIFELGSLVCGLSQSVGQLIAGRTVSGLGAAGLFVAMIQIISQVTRLEDRPRLFGFFGAVFGVSSVVGPLMGGALTDHVTWRWCFWINLPLGGVSILGVLFMLKASPPLGSDPTKRSFRDIMEQVRHLDFVGATLVAAAVTTLVLALQWGGNTKPWGDKDVIICFVFAAVLTVALIAWEIYIDETAMVPTSIFKSRSVYALLVFSFLTRFSQLIFSYYIPIFYQAVRGHTATKSGIDLLPFMLGTVLTIISAGQIVGKWGYYWPFLVGSPIFLALGSGLLYTLNGDTSSAKLVGFQILAGVGIGMGMQNSLLAMQVEFRNTPKILAQATSMVSFAQFLGGTLGLGVAEPIFASELTKNLLKYAPNAPAAIVKESPTTIRSALPADMIAGVVRSYTESLRIVFVVGVPIAGLGLIAASMIKNLRITKEAPPAAAAAAPAAPATTGDADVEKGAVA